MSLKIIWSPASKEEYAIILGYAEDNFGIDAALKLLDKTDVVIWNEDKPVIIGITPIGRAMVHCLKVNRQEAINLTKVIAFFRMFSTRG